MEKVKTHETEISVEERLRALYTLQLVDSEIDKIKTLRGELPLEVQDLEDVIAGLETRLANLKEEVVNLEKAISKKHNEINSVLNLSASSGQCPVWICQINRVYDPIDDILMFSTIKTRFLVRK